MKASGRSKQLTIKSYQISIEEILSGSVQNAIGMPVVE